MTELPRGRHLGGAPRAPRLTMTARGAAGWGRPGRRRRGPWPIPRGSEKRAPPGPEGEELCPPSRGLRLAGPATRLPGASLSMPAGGDARLWGGGRCWTGRGRRSSLGEREESRHAASRYRAGSGCGRRIRSRLFGRRMGPVVSRNFVSIREPTHQPPSPSLNPQPPSLGLVT